MPKRANTVVVGGGVIGMSCAWRLAQAGAMVTLLERRICSAEATGASLGVLTPSTPTRRGPIQQFHRQSLWTFEAFADELREASGIDVGFERRGRFEVLHDDQRRRMALREAEVACADWSSVSDGPVMEVLNPADARELEPGVVIGEFGAVLCRATAQVSVEGLGAALRGACCRAGVEVLQEREVTRIDTSGGQVCGLHVRGRHDRQGHSGGVRRGDEFIETPTVLAAAGAWSSQLCPELANHAAVRPVRGQAILLEPKGPVPQQPMPERSVPEKPVPERPVSERPVSEPPMFSRIIKRRAIYLLCRADGRVLLGSTTEPQAGFDCRSTTRGVAALTAGALELFPALADFRVAGMWAGLRPEAKAGRPIMGAIPGVRGLYVATGHYKTGLAMAPAVGKMMCDLILTGTTELDAAPFRPVA